MKPQVKNLIFIGVISVLIYLVYLTEQSWIYWGVPYIMIFLSTLLLINQKLQQGIFGTKIPVFYLILISFRLILGGLVAFLFIYFDRSGSVLFVINFFVLYLTFLAFEVFSLLSKLRERFQKIHN